MNWQNQYRENDYTSKSNLCVQWNPHQNYNDISHRDYKINPKVHLVAQMTVNSLGKTEQIEQC
jgi:hypothetical protein